MSKRRITEVALVDGKRYRFAEVPTSPALAQRFVSAAEGNADGGKLGAKGMIDATYLSLELAGYNEAERDRIGWLIDLEDEEVVGALTRAMFSASLIGGGSAVDAAPGVVVAGVGNDAAGAGGGDRGGARGDGGAGGVLPP